MEDTPMMAQGLRYNWNDEAVTTLTVPQADRCPVCHPTGGRSTYDPNRCPYRRYNHGIRAAVRRG